MRGESKATSIDIGISRVLVETPLDTTGMTFFNWAPWESTDITWPHHEAASDQLVADS